MTWRRERRCLASLSLRARASRRRQGNRLARPPAPRGPVRRPRRCLAVPRAERRGAGGTLQGLPRGKAWPLAGGAGVVAPKGLLFFLSALKEATQPLHRL
jgi:hypothetical protein